MQKIDRIIGMFPPDKFPEYVKSEVNLSSKSNAVHELLTAGYIKWYEGKDMLKYTIHMIETQDKVIVVSVADGKFYACTGDTIIIKPHLLKDLSETHKYDVDTCELLYRKSKYVYQDAGVNPTGNNMQRSRSDL